MFNPERKGKMATVDRAGTYSTSEILVFIVANTLINTTGLVEIIKAFVNPKVGMVAGKKRVQIHNVATNDTVNEGLFWKYESWLKGLDSEVSCYR